MLHLPPFASLQKFAASIKRKTRFGIFLCQMKFQKNLHHTIVLGSLLLNLLEKFQTVYRLNHRDIRCDILHLIGLQMTNEMPFDVLRQRSHLLGEFLFVTLAEDTLSFSISLLDILVGMELADGNETDAGRQAAQHLMEISFYIIHSSIIFAPRIQAHHSSPLSSR